MGGHVSSRRDEVGAGAVTPRVIRVLPDVPAIDKTFDYVVPPALDDRVRVGTLVRIALHGRRMGAWVVADGVEPPAGVTPQPIAKVTGWGPAPDVVELAQWAAWRWAGRRASFLKTASAPVAIGGLPTPRPSLPMTTVTDELVVAATAHARGVLRLPPARDPFSAVEQAVSTGRTLVLEPSVDAAALTARRLKRAGRSVALMPREWASAAGGVDAVVGTRAAAWAPVVDLACVVVVDAHEEVYQEERAPTWNAWQVAAERARRTGSRCLLVSPCPSLEMLDWGDLVVGSRTEERAGWPVVEVIDRRRDDPRTGLFSERLVRTLRGGGRVVCVLNRKGRARLLACSACGELARCERCAAAVELHEEHLVCRTCDAVRPPLCTACGSQKLKVLRAGVTRVREQLEALAGVAVGEVTGESEEVPETPVLVGTEAVLHRVTSADAVAFLDFDQELLAPRYRAAEQALALLARAARLVGGRDGGGRLLVQTRVPRHDAVDAALHADPGRLAQPERARREALGFPPATAIAAISGPAAEAFVGAVRDVEVLGPDAGRWLVRAPDHRHLCDALAAVPRPAGRLRVEVDPLRL